ASPNAGPVTVNIGSTLRLDNTATNVQNRLDGASLTLAGGSFTYVGIANSASVEALGNLTLNSGASTITSQTGNASSFNFLSFNSLTRNPGATVTIFGTNNILGNGNNNITFTQAPTLNSGGILAYALVDQNTGLAQDFATYDPVNGITPFSNYVTSNTAGDATTVYKFTNISGAGAMSNVTA